MTFTKTTLLLGVACLLLLAATAIAAEEPTVAELKSLVNELQEEVIALRQKNSEVSNLLTQEQDHSHRCDEELRDVRTELIGAQSEGHDDKVEQLEYQLQRSRDTTKSLKNQLEQCRAHKERRGGDEL